MKLVLLASLFFVKFSLGQKDSTIYFKELGWAIKIPADFKIKRQKYNGNLSGAKTIIEASRSSTDFFNITFTTSTSITLENWEDSDRVAKGEILKEFVKKIPIEPTLYKSFVGVDGIEFKDFEADYKINEKVTFHLLFLSAFLKSHYILISYYFINNPDEFLNMIDKSKFDK
jgi:hypothetical protein